MLKKYVILTTQRTGSSWLCDVLHSHLNVRAYAELFRITPEEDYPAYCTKDTMLFEKWLKTQSYFDKTFRKKLIYSKYINEIIDKAQQQQGADIIGFKLMYAQEKVNKDLWPYLIENIDNFIHLKRENLLDRAISKIYMENTGIAHAGEQSGNLPSNPVRTLPLSEVLSVLRQSVVEQEKYEQKLAQLPQNKVKIIIYEDMVENLEEVLLDLYRFLDIKFQAASSNFKKLSDQSPRDYVQNYDQLMSMALDEGFITERVKKCNS